MVNLLLHVASKHDLGEGAVAHPLVAGLGAHTNINR